MARRSPDEAKVWVRQAVPDDDYLAPADPEVPVLEVYGQVQDDEGLGPEAIAWAEKTVRPELRRSRQHAPRFGPEVKVRTNGRTKRAAGTYTREDYVEAVAPPPGRRPDQTTPPRPMSSCRQPVTEGWYIVEDEDGKRLVSPWEFDPSPIDESALTRSERDDDEYTDLADDEYTDLAELYVDYDDDDRPQWHKDLEARGEMLEDAPLDEDEWDEPPLAPIEASAHCGNPNGCRGQVKADERCSACHEYRRTHRGEERPLRLINRSKRRQTPS